MHRACSSSFLFRKRFSFFFDIDQQADRLLPLLRRRSATAVRKKSVVLAQHSVHSERAPRCGLGCHLNSAIAADQRREGLVHRLWNSKQLGDHAHRHRIGEFLDQIFLRYISSRTKHSVYDFLDLRPQRFRSRRAEAFVRQLPHPDILRRTMKIILKPSRRTSSLDSSCRSRGSVNSIPLVRLTENRGCFATAEHSAWLTTAQTRIPAHVHQMQRPFVEPAMIGGIGSWTNSSRTKLFAPQLDEIRLWIIL
jgi:hypothetical protein